MAEASSSEARAEVRLLNTELKVSKPGKVCKYLNVIRNTALRTVTFLSKVKEFYEKSMVISVFGSDCIARF